MSPNLFTPTDHAATLTRIGALTATTPRLWGTMTTGQMVVHCTDQIRICTGDKTISTRVPGLLKPVLRWALFNLMPRFPKNMRTLPELDPAQAMTVPTSFEADRRLLLRELELGRHPAGRIYDHPAFGRLSHAQFGEIVWKHLDHHLRQFGQ